MDRQAFLKIYFIWAFSSLNNFACFIRNMAKKGLYLYPVGQVGARKKLFKDMICAS